MLLSLIPIFILAIFSSFTLAVKAGDPCKVLAESKTPTVKLVEACYKSFPFNREILRHTTEQLIKTLQLYVYLNRAKKEVTELGYSSHDIIRSLKRIQESTYRNDYEWHEAIRVAFVQLYDAHTIFISNCFSSIKFTQPFYLSKYKEPIHRVQTDVYRVVATSEDANEQDAEFLNAKILTQTFESDVTESFLGNYKTDNPRLNALTASARFSGKQKEPRWLTYPGALSLRTTLPKKPSIQYRFMDGRTYEREWTVHLPEFKHGKEFYDKFCANTRLSKPISLGNIKDSTFLLESGPQHETMTLAKESMYEPANVTAMYNRTTRAFELPDKKSKVFEPAVKRKPVVFTKSQALYRLISDPKIATWVISDVGISDTKAWHHDCAVILRAIAKHKIKRVILDVSGNSGGNPCFVKALVKALMKNSTPSSKVAGTDHIKDARLSPLFTLLTKKATKVKKTNFNVANYANVDTGEPFKAATDLLEPQEHDGASFTQPFTDVCQEYPESPLFAIEHKLKAKDFLLLSDGLCGSACGRFAFLLTEVYEVHSISVGSWISRGSQEQNLIASFPATQVYKYRDLINDIANLKINPSKIVPEPLVISAQFTFAIRETFSLLDPSTPLEFVLTSDKKMVKSFSPSERFIFRPAAIWEGAAGKHGWVGQKDVDKALDQMGY